MNRNVRLGAAVMLRPITFLAYALSGLFPRDRNWWVFGSWSGKNFTDNSGALISHICDHVDGGPRVTWITASRTIAREARARGIEAHMRWHPMGIWACLRAGVYVFDCYTKDINHWLSRGSLKVLLRHGIGIKRVDRDISLPTHRLYKLYHGNPLQRLFWSYMLPWHTIQPDFALATSEEHAGQALDFFGLSRDNLVITGFPRYDALFRDRDEVILQPGEAQAVKQMEQSPSPVFLFMPTFREGMRQHDFEWDQWNELGREIGATIFVKLHYIDSQRGTTGTRHQARSNLRFVDPSADPINLYRAADALITDFSSTAFDFMLLNKPLVYFVPDYESYLSQRDLYFPFEEVTPGPICRDFDELSRVLRKYDSEAEKHRELYDELRDRFHTFRDAGSSSRAYAAIAERLGTAAGTVADSSPPGTRLDVSPRRTIMSNTQFVPLKETIARVTSPAMRRQMVRVRDEAQAWAGQGRRMLGSRGSVPDFIIIGAQKCGTTRMYDELARHPAVLPAKTKEVRYFGSNYHRPFDWYRTFFPMVDHSGHITGEATPGYVFHPEVPRRIADALPDVKLIVLLRDPVGRALSHYHHEVRLGFETLPLEEALASEERRLAHLDEGRTPDDDQMERNYSHFSYRRRGHYSTQLRRWFDVFGRDRILVVQSERFYRSTSIVLTEVLDHLGLDAGGFQPGAGHQSFEYPDPPTAVVEELREYFQPHNEDLYALLGRRFDW